ncbi:MAG: CBS domain-containing protein [Flavobacteriaceae bacterium]|nr:CBS domain-containing protein [Flavobacteriaceae bacterium]
MAVKSFQGARAKAPKAPNPPLLVSDYMTRDLITFTPDQSILQIMETFAKHRISGGPVVDKSGKLIGIISEADCMKQISESRYFNMPILEKSVAHFMTTAVNTINHDATIFDAARRFHQNSRRRLPVLKNGLLVGQISRRDVVLAALKLRSQRWR